MASHNPFDLHLAPFNWRVLVPLLAKLLPFGLQANFMLVTWSAIWATGVVLFLLVRAAGFGRALDAFGVLLFFSLGWGAKFVLADFWIPDGVAFLAITSATLLAVRKQPLAFALVVAAGVAAKESVIFVAPLYYALNARALLDGRLLVQTVVVTLPAVLTVALIRLAIPAYNGDQAYLDTLPDNIRRFPEIFPVYNYLSLARDIGYHQRLEEFNREALRNYTLGSWGIAIPLLTLVGIIARSNLALRLSPLLVCVYAQLLFATDTQRLIVAAFPAAIWLAVAGADTVAARFSLPTVAFLPLAAALFALNAVTRDSYGVNLAAHVVTVGAFAGSLAVWKLARSRRAGTRRPSPARREWGLG